MLVAMNIPATESRITCFCASQVPSNQCCNIRLVCHILLAFNCFTACLYIATVLALDTFGKKVTHHRVPWQRHASSWLSNEPNSAPDENRIYKLGIL